MNVVARSLYDFYRPVALWYWGVITIVVLAITAVAARVYRVEYSFWLIVTGQAAKWWLLALGALLVSVHLRLLVANGVTRRGFLAGAGLFGALAAVVFAALVTIGHGVERLAWTAAGPPPPEYPAFSAGDGLREFGHYLPSGLGWLVSGALFAAAFYRYQWWAGLLLLIPFALPLVASEVLLGMYAAVEIRSAQFVAYPIGLALSLLVSALGAAAAHHVLRDVPIRPSAG